MADCCSFTAPPTRRRSPGADGLGFVFSGAFASNFSVGSGATGQVNTSAVQSGGSVLTSAPRVRARHGHRHRGERAGALLQKYGATTSITIGSGGMEIVNAGVDSAAQILGLNGLQVISAGMSAVDALVSGTNAQQQIFGVAISTTVAAGGADAVEAGGHATGATVVSGIGGNEFVSGVASGTVDAEVAGGHGQPPPTRWCRAAARRSCRAAPPSTVVHVGRHGW